MKNHNYNVVINNNGDYMLNLLAQVSSDPSLTLTTSETSSAAAATGFMAFFAAYAIFVLAIYVVAIVALWKLFEKAGIAGWKSIIPIYNGWLLFQMAGKPGWWSLVSLAGIVPVLGFIAVIAQFVLYILAALELGKAFKKDTTWTVLFLIIFNLVGLLILGFGKDKYTKPATAPAKLA